MVEWLRGENIYSGQAKSGVTIFILNNRNNSQEWKIKIITKRKKSQERALHENRLIRDSERSEEQDKTALTSTQSQPA